MKRFKSFFSVALAVFMVLVYSTTDMAAETFQDVSSNAYYADAVEYVFENGLIAGTEQGIFSPNMQLNRGMFATMLWRNEGQPQTNSSTFADVNADSYYATTIGWAADNGIVSGYGENLFGPNDPIERQQLAVMLYRYAEYNGNDMDLTGNVFFKDYLEIADYAKNAAVWANENGVIAGKENNRFDPFGNATRAEAVTMLYRYITNNIQEDTGLSEKSTDTLVVYFSWSGNTEEMASYIAEQTGGELLELEPLNAYPNDYTETGNIAREERDYNERPAIANLPDSIEEYDTILVGYPIWWHTAPMIIGTFLENYDLSEKDIYPFTQSASMDTEQFGNSMSFIRENAANANVHDGLFVRPSNIEAIDLYLKENGLVQ